jgi:hypothetical protein
MMFGELEEEHLRFADSQVWVRSEIQRIGGIRYFLAWLKDKEGMDDMQRVVASLCSNIREFFSAALKLSRSAEHELGSLDAWLEAKICMQTKDRSGRYHNFCLRLDPGNLDERIVSVSILDMEGDEIGTAFFEL